MLNQQTNCDSILLVLKIKKKFQQNKDEENKISIPILTVSSSVDVKISRPFSFSLCGEIPKPLKLLLSSSDLEFVDQFKGSLSEEVKVRYKKYVNKEILESFTVCLCKGQ